MQPRLLGIDLGRTSLRYAGLRKKGKSWAITTLKEISLEEQGPLLKDELVISAIPTRDVLMRTCEIPLKKQKDILAALDFHVEPLLPFPLEKAMIQAQVATQLDHATLLNVFAVRKDHLAIHLENLKNAHIEPEIVTSRLHALSALSALLPQTNFPFLIFHEGEEEYTLLLLEKGSLLATRSIDPKKDFFREIQTTLLSFTTLHKHKSFELIYFFGKNPELKQVLQKETGKAVQLPSTPHLSLTQEEFVQYGLALGSALAHSGINFRQKEYTFPHPFRRLKKPLITYFTLSFLLAGAVYFSNECSLFQKKQEIHLAYEALLDQEKIKPFKATLETSQDYSIALNSLEKELKARPEIFPLAPQIPKVKELLSWLASITKQQGEELSPICIESMHYHMVKRPDFSHHREHYKVRIDLEFVAKDVSALSAFQEALKSSQSLADLNEEIQWIPAKGKYRVSFFLKDKTKYG